MKQQRTDRRRRVRKQRAGLVILIILFIAIGVFAIRKLNKPTNSGDITSEESVFGTEAETETETETAAAEFHPDTDPNASDWNGALTGEDYDTELSGGIRIPSFSSFTIPKNEETVSITLMNPADNPCYFTFYIVLQDTGEVLYTSGLVPPGQAITSVTLNRTLKAGEYNAIIQIAATSLEDGSAMGGANVKTVLIVQ